jgi:hypothetical protein
LNNFFKISLSLSLSLIPQAQWKAPCGAHGKMECQSGHKVKMNPSITCDAQVCAMLLLCVCVCMCAYMCACVRASLLSSSLSFVCFALRVFHLANSSCYCSSFLLLPTLI